MADSDTTDQAQANNVADQPPFQAAIDAKAAKKAEKQALTEAKMQRWLNDGDDGLSWYRTYDKMQRWINDYEVDISCFIGYGGTAGHADVTGSA